VTDETRATMRKILAQIQDGSFARAWIAENEQGRPQFARTRSKEQEQLLEQVGIKLRAMMPFLDPVTVKPDGIPA
jgi:ketol-acid reductoisomerase